MSDPAPLTRRSLTAVVALVATCGLFGWSAPGADATFPGPNGNIVFGLGQSNGGGESDQSCSSPTCEDFRLVALNPGTRRTAVLATSCQARECHDIGPAVDRLGARILFERDTFPLDRPAEAAFGLAKADGSDLQLISEAGRGAAWAPDGRHFVYSRAPGGSAGEQLYIYDLEQGSFRQLTREGGYDADWSSTDRIVFTRQGKRPGGGPSAKKDLYTISPSGGRAKRVTRTGSADFASWSPHGSQIAYVDSSGRFGAVAVIRANGGHPRRLVRSDAMPQWSPDGKRIALALGTSIWIVNRDGTGSKRLYTARDTGNHFPIGRLSWSRRRR